MNPLHEIEIDEDVCEYIKKKGKDFRLCTTCSGPLLIPAEFASIKDSDLKIEVDEHTLFVSAVQARYINCINRYMVPYQEQYYCP